MQIDKDAETLEFVKSSFKSILALHEELIREKDGSYKQLKEENELLKESLLFIQDIYEKDKEVMEIFKKEIKTLQDELEFTKRKYKLMWNQAVENYKR